MIDTIEQVARVLEPVAIVVSGGAGEALGADVYRLGGRLLERIRWWDRDVREPSQDALVDQILAALKERQVSMDDLEDLLAAAGTSATPGNVATGTRGVVIQGSQIRTRDGDMTIGPEPDA